MYDLQQSPTGQQPSAPADEPEKGAFQGDHCADLRFGEQDGPEHGKLANPLVDSHVERREDDEQRSQERNAGCRKGLPSDRLRGRALIEFGHDLLLGLDFGGRSGMSHSVSPVGAKRLGAMPLVRTTPAKSILAGIPASFSASDQGT